jgi:hypothetical protein
MDMVLLSDDFLDRQHQSVESTYDPVSRGYPDAEHQVLLVLEGFEA